MSERKKSTPKVVWHCRVDPYVSERANAILADIGLTRSAAVNMFATAIVRSGGLPIPVTSVLDAQDTEPGT